MAWLAATALLVQAWAAALSELHGAAVLLDDVVVALAATIGLGLSAWVALAAACTALSVLLPVGSRAARTAERCVRGLVPAAVRPVLALTIGTAVLTGPVVAPAAWAAPVIAATVAGAPSPAEADLPAADRLALDHGRRAADTPQPALDPRWATRRDVHAMADLDPSWGHAQRRRPAVDPEQTVVVRRGDSLWDIAARHLGPYATDAEIADAWPAWFAANRSVVGADPDRLLPGQRLHPPTSGPAGGPG